MLICCMGKKVTIVISLHQIYSFLDFLLFKTAFVDNLFDYILDFILLKPAKIIKLRLKIDIFCNIIPACNIAHNNRRNSCYKDFIKHGT